MRILVSQQSLFQLFKLNNGKFIYYSFQSSWCVYICKSAKVLYYGKHNSWPWFMELALPTQLRPMHLSYVHLPCLVLHSAVGLLLMLLSLLVFLRLPAWEDGFLSWDIIYASLFVHFSVLIQEMLCLNHEYFIGNIEQDLVSLIWNLVGIKY